MPRCSSESTGRWCPSQQVDEGPGGPPALVIAGFIAVLVVFSRTYLEPYGSPLGQLVLAVVGAYWAAGFWWMHRMGQIAPTQRFLRPHEVTA